ncbi:tyrosine-type recombinase/integrase [Streptomyces sp. NPDC048157]|uniref:tyrosine-type recombinase/integrase n=1 Tax=Streptomyces sp. NPDC048157 TaxID=3365503 RepID=UPI00370FB3EB
MFHGSSSSGGGGLARPCRRVGCSRAVRGCSGLRRRTDGGPSPSHGQRAAARDHEPYVPPAWTDARLDAGLITVAKQLVVDGWEVYEDDPKTDAGARTIALDADTVEVLRQHRARQDEEREKWGTARVETGRVFTRENGELLHPANVTRRFIELYEEIGLPPVRLHDLRHGAATLAHAAGADLKDIQEMLGHSSITITADTYTSLLPEAELAIAEAAARLVPRARAPRDVPDGVDRLGDISGAATPSAHAARTQTALDGTSGAE